MTSRERLLYAVAIALALVSGIAIGQSRAASPSAPDPVTWAPVLTGTPRALGTAGVYEVAPRATTGVPSSPAVASEQPTPRVSVPDSTPTSTAGRPASGPSSSVTATFYCNADLTRYRRSACRKGYPDRIGVDDLFAAVSADLAFLDGKRFTAWYRGRHVTVRAVDRCACGSRKLDLYLDAWLYLASIGTGRLYGVTIQR